MTGAPDEILLEIQALGGSLRVTALDPASLTEVVFQAPLGADRASIERLARQKLAYRLGRSEARPGQAPGRGGTVV